MRRPPRARPAVERLEDRWCPSFVPSFNPSNGTLTVTDYDNTPNLTFVYKGGPNNDFAVYDYGQGPSSPTVTPSLVAVTPSFPSTASIQKLYVQMAGTQDVLYIDGSYNTLGNMPVAVAASLDGRGPEGMNNFFGLYNANLVNAAGLVVVSYGAWNEVDLGTPNTSSTGAPAGTSATPVTVQYQNSPDNGGVNAEDFTNAYNFNTSSLTINSLGGTALAPATDTINLGTGPAKAVPAFTPSPPFPFAPYFTPPTPFPTASPAPAYPPFTTFYDYGNLSINEGTNALGLTVTDGQVGSGSGNSFQVLGGGSNTGSNITLGDGTTAFKDLAGTVFDHDDFSGFSDGTVSILNNVKVTSSLFRIDDYGTVNVLPFGGSATLPSGSNSLTIWNSDGGSTVTLGDAINSAVLGTITGNVSFFTGKIAGDTDAPPGTDAGSPAGAMDLLQLLSNATLNGTLSATLNTSTDTVDVEGTVTKNLTVTGTGGSASTGPESVTIGQTAPAAVNGNVSVALDNSPNDMISVGTSGTGGTGATIGGAATLGVGNGNFDSITVGAPGGTGATVGQNSTITEGSGSQDSITVDTTATFSRKLSISLGGANTKTLFFNGTVGFGLAAGTNLTVTSGAGASVFARLGPTASVHGSVNLNLSASATNFVDYDMYTGGGTPITTVFATASPPSGGNPTSFFDPDGQTTGFVLIGTWGSFTDPLP